MGKVLRLDIVATQSHRDAAQYLSDRTRMTKAAAELVVEFVARQIIVLTDSGHTADLGGFGRFDYKPARGGARPIGFLPGHRMKAVIGVMANGGRIEDDSESVG